MSRAFAIGLIGVIGIGGSLLPAARIGEPGNSAPVAQWSGSLPMRAGLAPSGPGGDTTGTIGRPPDVRPLPSAGTASDLVLPAESEPDLMATPSPPAGIERAGLTVAIALYRKGDLAGGDVVARGHTEPLAKTMLEWVALRTNPRDSGLARILAFLAAHPDWPSAAWLRRRVEEDFFADRTSRADVVIKFFADQKPLSVVGKLALARADLSLGRSAEAAGLVREAWREGDLQAAIEPLLVKEFGGYLTPADYKYRAERLLYKEAVPTALRAAERAGPDEQALARARAAVIANSSTGGLLLDALPPALKQDPGYQFSRIQSLRRADKVHEAAALLLAAPHGNDRLIDGDAWWAERRMIARKLLDLGEVATAYRLCSENDAQSAEAKVDAEFHAGWIALRFLDDPSTAAAHFAQAAAAAEVPEDIARANYWQGRAAEASNHAAAAAKFYEIAAANGTSYYGLIARGKLARSDWPIHLPATMAAGSARHEAVQIIELLYAIGETDLAFSLAVDSTANLPDEAQVAALGAVATSYHDAHASLVIGKLAANRGIILDEFAFPTYGIPIFEPVANSADRAVVYAIARQESAFGPTAISGAGAKGLMQLLASTARETAQRAKIDFDEARLTRDAGYNAKLGAAYLGSLLDAEKGSFILAFAAYNAGFRRVQDWITAHGDPRDPAVDPIDWIELIPFDETRHYVQQIMENMEVYRLRFGERTAMLIDSDLHHTSSGL